jgi:hypothetical protein
LKPLAIDAEINVGDVGAVSRARAYSLQPRLQLVNVDRVVVRRHGEKFPVGAAAIALHLDEKWRETMTPVT